MRKSLPRIIVARIAANGRAEAIHGLFVSNRAVAGAVSDSQRRNGADAVPHPCHSRHLRCDSRDETRAHLGEIFVRHMLVTQEGVGIRVARVHLRIIDEGKWAGGGCEW